MFAYLPTVMFIKIEILVLDFTVRESNLGLFQKGGGFCQWRIEICSVFQCLNLHFRPICVICRVYDRLS